MIRFKILSRQNLKNIYNFFWLGQEGTIEIKLDTDECVMTKTSSLLNEKEKGRILFIAGKYLRQKNFPDSYTYATH